MTTHSWDEDPTGAWMLEIENVAGASDYGKAVLLLHKDNIHQLPTSLQPPGK